MLSMQQLRRIVHVLCSQRLGYPPGAMSMQCRSDLAVEYDETIASCCRRKPRMKIIGYGPRPGDRDIVRQIAVCTEQPTTLAAIAIGVEVYNLAACVHAGVCTPRAAYINVFVGNFGERLFNDRLYTVACPLGLPAVVRGPVVLNAKSNAQSGR